MILIDDTFLTQKLTEAIQNMTQSEFSTLLKTYHATSEIYLWVLEDSELSFFDEPIRIAYYVIDHRDSLGNSTIKEILNDWENRQKNTERKIMQVIETMHGEDIIKLFNAYGREYGQIYEMFYIDDALDEFRSFSDGFDSLADDFDYNAPYVYVDKGIIHSAEQNEFSAEHPLIKPHLKEIVKCVSHSCGLLSDYPELKRIVEES